MVFKNIKAPDFDNLIYQCQHYPEVKDEFLINKLHSVFEWMCKFEQQGDDEFRSLWIIYSLKINYYIVKLKNIFNNLLNIVIE